MACDRGPTECRAQHIAAKLRDAKQDSADYESRCPACGHGGFRISQARVKSLRHVWACACRKCRCDPAAVRASLLALGIMPGCLGLYAASVKASTDLNMAARLDAATSDILAAPHLKPSDIRIVLAEARGQKIPGDVHSFVPWAMSIGISRTRAYEAAARWCRPSGSHPSPGGGVEDQS